ncbi:unnamed protein product [Linum trigynum]|uniref:Uncharacterized protein n=1 Tax=Linum trigynum TaxID=586398 RepID=A0AAV2E543_9ROSI
MENFKASNSLDIVMEKFEETCFDMDFQPLPPPILTLQVKVAQACACFHLIPFEGKDEAEKEIHEHFDEQEKLIPENSCNEYEQEETHFALHTSPHHATNFKKQVTMVK